MKAGSATSDAAVNAEVYVSCGLHSIDLERKEENDQGI
jgi:hypothetical protein